MALDPMAGRPDECMFPGCTEGPMVGFQTGTEELCWLCNEHFAVALQRVGDWIAHAIAARWN